MSEYQAVGQRGGLGRVRRPPVLIHGVRGAARDVQRAAVVAPREANERAWLLDVLDERAGRAQDDIDALLAPAAQRKHEMFPVG